MGTKPIRYCDHLKGRLALRGIAYDLPATVIQVAERVFWDTETGYKIAVSEAAYRGGTHLMMVAFEETDEDIVAVTIHPLDAKDVKVKLRSGRWRP